MELNTHLLDRNKERIVNSDLKSKKVLVLEETESGFMRVVDLKVGWKSVRRTYTVCGWGSKQTQMKEY